MANELKARREALEILWQKGLSGRALLLEHTTCVDRYLAESFKQIERGPRLSLVALGGYGRQELFPFSDIDLLLLHDNASEEELNAAAEKLFYPLWDAGLEVGHGVRTPDGCLDDAVDDYFFRVALLDARLLAGSRKLFEALQSRFQKVFIEGNRKDFLEKMQHYRRERQQRFGMHTYLLEPQIKEGRGGLRDVQSMLWTGRVVFGIGQLEKMEEAGLLSAAERRQFERAWDILIRIRNRLHFISGRKNDQLFFEHQEEMATGFGYKKRNGMLAVEHFMRNVHEAMQTIAVITGLFFEHVDEVLGMVEIGEAAFADQELEAGISIRLGRIHLLDQVGVKSKPLALLRLFYHAAHTGLPLHYRTRKIVQESLTLVDEKFRHSRRAAKTFFETLTGPYAADALGTMLETGLLAAYLPEFAPLVSLAQHDVYHVNTVDRHLLQTVRELHVLEREEKDIFQLVPSPQLLYLAGLLHDVGKGMGHGHAERGAEIVGKTAERLGLSSEERDILVFLVANHLFLMHMALRRDLEDATMIGRCAGQMQSCDRLSMLYLLSIADAKATGPTVWNDWKAALLLELYLKIAHLLDRKDLSENEQVRSAELGAQWIREKVSELLPDGAKINFALFSDDYLLSFPPEVIVEHIVQAKQLEKQEVLFFHEEKRQSWSILVMTKDRHGLLARIFGVLALHNLNVLAAKIFTWADGTAVDIIEVSSAISEFYAEQDWQAAGNDLRLAIKQRLGLEFRLSRKLAPLRNKPQGVQQRLEAKVAIDNKASELYTVVEVFSADRIGLLYDVTKTLSDFGLSIYRARIGSKADQVVDVFYVQDNEGEKVEDSDFKKELQQGLLYAVTNA